MIAIDMFAGWGGFTEGARAAGIEVAWASNHWPPAVAVHTLNHPETTHVCQDLRQADWTTLPRYDILLASPACQGHSTASQPARRPYHDAMRATAWAVVDCADVTEPRHILIENVPSFLSWRLYPVWESALREMGYHIDRKVLSATAYGVPQKRRRLFILASRERLRLVDRGAHREAAFRPCLDLESGEWRPVRSAKPNAQRRIRRAQQRCGSLALSQHVTGHPGVPVHEPIRTITTKDQWVVVNGARYRPLTPREYARGMGFRDTFTWDPALSRADVIKGLGNAVCPPQAEGILADTFGTASAVRAA